MPKKNVWEMSVFERLHYSLSGKTFRAVILLSLIISIAAVAFGFFLYTTTVNREYRVMTWHLSATAAEALDIDEIRRQAESVLGVYNSMTPEERLENGQEAYLQKYSAVLTPEFQAFRELIHSIQVKNDAIAAYTAALDTETNRMIFIADGDPNDTFCPPGSWDELEPREIDAFMNGAKPSLLDRFYGTQSMSAVISNMEQYGYRCTAGTKLFEAEGYPVFIFFDTDMNDVADMSRTFLLQYVLLLLIVTVLTALFFLRHLKKTVVTPINELAAAALAYTNDVQDGHRSGRHFAELDIRTGDEIENLALTMKAMEDDLASYIRNLSKVTAEKERIGTELSLATRIQADMLPNIFPAFPDRAEFDLYASMTPAKEVGGDFYDFFLIDDSHLGLVMADVSGKGVPAALFMMASKILVKNYAMTGRSPKEVLRSVNDQICKNNREEMFVTVWFGILDLDSGVLTAANAGHEYPILKHQDSDFEVIKDKHGFVIGGMEGMRYKEYHLQLEPGSKLFLYTDGVAEATDSGGELFGLDRTLGALNSKTDGTPRELLETVYAEVGRFVGDAPQFDDFTMLCLHYLGKDNMKGAEKVKELTVEAAVSNIDTVTDFINAELELLDCPMKAQMQIDIAIDEIMSNISNYAYAPGTGQVTVRMEREDEPRAVLISFSDSGVPFDPLAADDPDTTLSADERKVGGLGVFVVKKTMDDVSYEYKDGQNILRIKKLI